MKPFFQKKKFNRDRLPHPLDYYRREFPNIKVRGQWGKAHCPFHKGGQEKHPSLSLNLSDGFFKCFTCDVKGRDVLSFHMQRYNLGFIEASIDLNAWDGGGYE